MDDKLVDVFRKTMPLDNLEIIPILFFCKFFDLEYDKHSKYLSNDKSFEDDLYKVEDKELYDDNKKRISLSKNGFIRWVLQINSSSLSPTIHTLFKNYQKNLINYLFSNAYEQQRVLLKLESLKGRRQTLYNGLHDEREDFVEYIAVVAEIMRLGKENKAIQQNIVHSSQTRLF